MLVADHLRKIRRIQAGRARLDASIDCELWFFQTLSLCIHGMNAALHSLGTTIEEECFAHNVPVYVRRQGAAVHFVIRPFGDIEHVDSPEIEAMIPPQLTQAKVALLYLEKIRDPIVRAGRKVEFEETVRIEAACNTCLKSSLSFVLSESHGRHSP